MTAQIRWMIRADMPEILMIEEKSFPDPWTEQDFLEQLKQRNCIGKVAIRNGQLAAYVIYELERTAIRIVNFVVAPVFRGEYIGSELMDHVLQAMQRQKRRCVTAYVWERNVGFQMFLKSRGFYADASVRGYYDSGDDCYVFRRSLDGTREPFEVIVDAAQCEEYQQ